MEEQSLNEIQSSEIPGTEIVTAENQAPAEKLEVISVDIEKILAEQPNAKIVNVLVAYVDGTVQIRDVEVLLPNPAPAVESATETVAEEVKPEEPVN